MISLLLVIIARAKWTNINTGNTLSRENGKYEHLNAYLKDTEETKTI